MISEKRICANCKFFEEKDIEQMGFEPEVADGLCRRYPRHGMAYSFSLKKDWCGEFKAKEHPELLEKRE